MDHASSTSEDLQSSILDSVSSTRSIPSKQVLILGPPSSGNSVLPSALLQGPIAADDSNDASRKTALILEAAQDWQSAYSIFCRFFPPALDPIGGHAPYNMKGPGQSNHTSPDMPNKKRRSVSFPPRRVNTAGQAA
ncbi:hypothetical protein HD554DRAFT_2113994 [Boletus coccyginus]|nr:hypothetical protein HD554DRAFT_2113994 [Boletus coccyginus]